MDLDLYSTLLRRHWMLLVAIIIVTTLGTVLLTVNRKSAYEGSVYVSVAQAPQSEIGTGPNSYRYGEFYAIQGSNYLADYFKGWLKDPATVEEILVTAGGGLPNRPIVRLSRYFAVKPLGTVGLQVFHTTGNHDETNRVLTALQTVLTRRLTALQDQGLYPDFRVVPGSVLVLERKPDSVVAGAIGFGAGLVLAGLVLLILATLRPVRHE